MERDSDAMSAGVSSLSENAMDPEELRKKLYTQLKNTGVVNALKTQLRSQLLGQLQHRYDVGFRKNGDQKKQDSTTKALNCAIAEYLEFAGHQYSLSIFQPECGTPCDALTREELMTLLGVPQESPARSLLNEFLEDQTDNQGACFLLAVFQTLKHVGGPPTSNGGGGKISSSTQTRDCGNAVALLSSQLQQVETAYAHRLGNGFRSKQMADQRVHYKHECDERVVQEVAPQASGFHRAQGSQSCLSDSDCWRKQLEEQREDLDRIHLARSQELHERESKMMEQLSQQRMEMERALLEHRKKMADEEQNFQWKKDEFERSCQARKNDIETAELELRDRERKVRRKELELEDGRDAIKVNLRRELNEELAHERKKLSNQKAALELMQERVERESEERVRLSLEKMKRSESKLEECQNIIQGHKLNEESLKRQLNAHKDALSRSTEILTQRQEKTLTALDRQLNCSFDSGAGSLGTIGFHKILQESNHHQNKVHKLTLKIRNLSKHNQKLEAELESFDEEIRRLKEKSLEQGDLLDEAISERMEALNHAEELRLKLGGSERRCSELKRKLERSMLEIVAFRASTQYMGATHEAGTHLAHPTHSVHSGMNPNMQAQHNFQHTGPSAVHPFIPSKEPSTPPPAPKQANPSVSLLKSPCLDTSSSVAEFSWQANQLEREEEVLKQKMKAFRRKVEMGRKNAERELHGIARRVERSRNRERSRREAASQSTNSDLSSDSNALGDTLSSASDEPIESCKAKLQKRNGQWEPVVKRKHRALQSKAHVQHFVCSETPVGGLPERHQGTPSPIMLTVSPALKHPTTGEQASPSTAHTEPVSSESNPTRATELHEKHQEAHYDHSKSEGQNDTMHERPAENSSENGSESGNKATEVLQDAMSVAASPPPVILSSKTSLPECETRAPVNVVPEVLKPQLTAQGTGISDIQGNGHAKASFTAAELISADPLLRQESQVGAADERSCSNGLSIEVASGSGDQPKQVSDLSQQTESAPQTQSPLGADSAPSPASEQTSPCLDTERHAAGAQVESVDRGVDGDASRMGAGHNGASQSEIHGEDTAKLEAVVMRSEGSDDDGLLVDALEAPGEDRSTHADGDSGDVSSETSFSSLPPELDSVGELSTGPSDGHEGRISWGGNF